MKTDTPVARSLIMVAEALADARDPWWIIGSAAVLLHGGDPEVIADIDVITSRRDLDRLNERLPLTDTPEAGKPMFVSERFGRWAEPELDVEFMTGLNLLEDGEWHSIVPQTRREIALGKHTLGIPDRREFIAMLHRFGREKDVRRAATLASD